MTNINPKGSPRNAVLHGVPRLVTTTGVVGPMDAVNSGEDKKASPGDLFPGHECTSDQSRGYRWSHAFLGRQVEGWKGGGVWSGE